MVERHLEGKNHELKESVIATEIFGRRADYNPKHDAIVRTEAGRLRARLSEYYGGEGRSDALVIEVPKGGYAPVFLQPEAPRENRGTGSGRLWLWLGFASLAVALAGVVWSRFQHYNVPVPIAVLPLINVNQDPANDYFADGLTDELIRNLSIIDGLAVRSRLRPSLLKASCGMCARWESSWT